LIKRRKNVAFSLRFSDKKQPSWAIKESVLSVFTIIHQNGKVFHNAVENSGKTAYIKGKTPFFRWKTLFLRWKM